MTTGVNAAERSGASERSQPQLLGLGSGGEREARWGGVWGLEK